jgi:hypothetical protein
VADGGNQLLGAIKGCDQVLYLGVAAALPNKALLPNN